MITRDFRYIIKRIIIGVAVALLVFLIKKNVWAKDVASVYNPFTTSNTEVVSNVNTYANFYISGNPWANRGVGYIRFNFSLIKVSGSSTDPVVVPTGVYANDYVCDVASTSTNNSTWTGNTFSAVCPVKMDSNGLTKIAIDLAANQQNTQSLYRITISPLISFETYDGPSSMSDTNTAISNQTTAINNQTTAITNNQNTNTQSIINNQNTNTQNIINNQNQNTQEQINSLRVCSVIDKNKIKNDNKILSNAGNEVANNNFGITDYIELYDNAKLTLKDSTTSNNPNLCFYTADKTKISCYQENSFTIGQEISIPSNAVYVRFTIRKDTNIPTFNLCINGNQALSYQQEQNTQSIINNQNINNEKQMQSQMICNSKDYSNSSQLKHSYLNSNGVIVENNDYGVSRYISLSDGAKIVVQEAFTGTISYNCFYDDSRTLISCSNLASEQVGDILSIPTGASYVRFSFRKNGNSYNVCSSGNQVLSDTLTDSDIDSSNSDFDDYIHGLELNHHGLTDLITSPLRLLNSFLTSSCTSLTIPLPFVDQDIVLPCMSTIYTTYFSDFLLLYRLITDGVIAYWVAVGTFRKIQGLLDPNDTRVEVFNL